MQATIHIYTGEGKGKTTASVGLCVRALGAGLKVLFVQFIKGGASSEFKILKQLDGFTFKAYGHGRFIKGAPSPDEIEAARAGLAQVAELLASGSFDLAVLDESCCAVSARLFSAQELLEALSGAPDGTEIVLTGRGAEPELLAAASLVSEINCVKHYYASGRQARKGIEF